MPFEAERSDPFLLAPSRQRTAVKGLPRGGHSSSFDRAANVGAFHVCLWAYTLTEAWAWGRSAAGLTGRCRGPWDDPGRRPSHADKRRALRRELLREEIQAGVRAGLTD